ncbi:hypothetical protein [Chlorogloea sp. CCALA 695]|uniref:hypothetical protein n=1 Tax=Chlorogloea sp. CCALA 695 TaxID=2107693 RepID=UPI000D06B517|nr:hypothetical protein [Chlorogloea sp. CCALA 695]PSB28680.1 hypothetical protein C7B70_20415 [Chlorogloea sp. CCALA 695]
MSKDNPFRKAIASRQPTEPNEPDSVLDVESVSLSVTQPPPVQASISLEPKKRGRPATGKRSDDAWIGRTFYIQRETDINTEGELLNLRRQGVELDKSELVDKLLSAWVQWRNGENLDKLLSEISPIQKSKNL